MSYKVAAYLRLSKEEFSNEKESNSITNQKLIIDNYLENNKKYKLVDYYICFFLCNKGVEIFFVL